MSENIITITRNKLVIGAMNALPYQNSANIKIEVIDDEYFSDYITQINCGYFSNKTLNEIYLTKEDGYFVLPATVFENAGPIYISLSLSKDDEVIVTNQINYTVRKSVSGTVTLPAEATWQELVSDYVQDLFDNFETNVLTPAQEEIAEAIEEFETEYDGAAEQVATNTTNIATNTADISTLNSNLSGESGTISMNNTTQTCKWQRVGNVVVLNALFYPSETDSSSSAVMIPLANLPFAPKQTQGMICPTDSSSVYGRIILSTSGGLYVLGGYTANRYYWFSLTYIIA